MRTLTKKLSILFVIIFLLSTVFCVPASATTKTLKEGVNTTIKGKIWYKITVPSYGYIEISGSRTENIPTKALPISCFDSSKANLQYVQFNPNPGKYEVKSIRMPVQKGTYYIKTEDYINSGKVKYTFKKMSLVTNYCIAKAKSLDPGVNATIYSTPSTSYYRWYKIKLTSKKRVTITYNHMFGNIIYGDAVQLYNSSFEKEDLTQTDSNGNVVFKSDYSLPKGTYYIRANPWDEGEMSKIKWK